MYSDTVARTLVLYMHNHYTLTYRYPYSNLTNETELRSPNEPFKKSKQKTTTTKNLINKKQQQQQKTQTNTQKSLTNKYKYKNV